MRPPSRRGGWLHLWRPSPVPVARRSRICPRSSIVYTYPMDPLGWGASLAGRKVPRRQKKRSPDARRAQLFSKLFFLGGIERTEIFRFQRLLDAAGCNSWSTEGHKFGAYAPPQKRSRAGTRADVVASRQPRKEAKPVPRDHMASTPSRPPAKHRPAWQVPVAQALAPKSA